MIITTKAVIMMLIRTATCGLIYILPRVLLYKVLSTHTTCESRDADILWKVSLCQK